jgi:hypothetical protein
MLYWDILSTSSLSISREIETVYNWPFNFQFYSAPTLACGHKNGLFFHRNAITLLATALVVFESLVVRT